LNLILETQDLKEYLQSSDVIDYENQIIINCAKGLVNKTDDEVMS
jgi:hypothetical protein